jgi:hypothetical protein
MIFQDNGAAHVLAVDPAEVAPSLAARHGLSIVRDKFEVSLARWRNFRNLIKDFF